MRKLVPVALVGLLGWWLTRSRRAAGDSVAVGYADGSSVTLPADAAAHGRIAALAREALRA